MKKTVSLLLAAALCGASLSAQNGTPQQQANNLKVLTYNVRNGLGTDDVADTKRVAQVIANSGADIVAVQEVDSMTRRSGRRYVLGDIAAQTLMHPLFAPAIDFDGGKYGIGLLCKSRPICVKHIALPGREEARVLQVAEFERYRIANVHLSLTQEDARASVDIIAQEAAADPKPFVVMGDWNSAPGSAVVEAMKAAGFSLLSGESAATWPADDPKQCIDYVALYKPAQCGAIRLASQVGKEAVASDHRPVYANIQFKMRPNEIVYHAPYLQNPGGNGVTVMFQTNALAHCCVEYGTDTLHLTRVQGLTAGQVICHDIEHKIRLCGLTAGKKYFYRVRAKEIIVNRAYSKTFGDEYVSGFYSFALPAEGEKDFTALIINDLHESKLTIDAWSALARKIPHDFVVFNGDCLPEPVDRAYAIRNTHILADKFDGASVPLFFIRGNHEIRNAYSSGMPSLFELPGEKSYGAFSWGDTRFVVLDCGEDKPDDTPVYYGLNDFTGLRLEQVDFLKAEMASKPFKRAARRVLIHHIPIWGNTDDYQPCSQLWQPLLAKAPFDVDIAAHTHEFKLHQRGELGNAMPVVIGGGGLDMKRVTLMVLSKRGKEMSLRVLNYEGEEILNLQL